MLGLKAKDASGWKIHFLQNSSAISTQTILDFIDYKTHYFIDYKLIKYQVKFYCSYSYVSVTSTLLFLNETFISLRVQMKH